MNFKNSKIKLVVSVVAAAILFTGCGSEEPKDMVKSHIEAWAKGDIEDAKKDLSPYLLGQVKKAEKKCVNNKNYKTTKEIKEIMISKISKELEELKKIKQSYIDKKQDFSKITSEEKIKIIDDVFKDSDPVMKAVLPIFKKILREEYSYRERRKLDNEAERLLIEAYYNEVAKTSNAKAECEKAIFSIKNFKKVNIIDGFTTDEPDLKEFKTEIVYKDGDSDKFTAGVELLDNEWKIRRVFTADYITY